MKIFNAATIREWDLYTIANEPVASIDLMERAASSCVDWLEANNLTGFHFHIYCGKGNNGGDGLAIARMLIGKECRVHVHILEFGHLGTDDFQQNLQRLHIYNGEISFIQQEHFTRHGQGEILIDCLYGTGLSRPLEGISAALASHINSSACPVIAIDIPSGMSADETSKNHTIVQADHTLSFQVYKKAFLLAENEPFTGVIHVLDIGLHPDFYEKAETSEELIDLDLVRSIYRPRNRFSHKGNFGHALIVAGSQGKIGAAILATRGALRSGAGLVSCHLPSCGYLAMQTATPEAMVFTDQHESMLTKLETDPSDYDAIGIGPGLGTSQDTVDGLKELLRASKRPVVLDADALNIMGDEKKWLKKVPENSILTPHPKEFSRLFGKTENDFGHVELARKKAEELNCVIVLKGHHSFIATPGGKGYFNATGNAGMATGGSGDVLTGIITGLLAQDYAPEHAAIFGVFLHGLAGDLAAKELSMEAMIAGDLVNYLGEAFKIVAREN